MSRKGEMRMADRKLPASTQSSPRDHPNSLRATPFATFLECPSPLLNKTFAPLILLSLSTEFFPSRRQEPRNFTIHQLVTISLNKNQSLGKKQQLDFERTTQRKRCLQGSSEDWLHSKLHIIQ